jgi:methionyl aminopeptidase
MKKIRIKDARAIAAMRHAGAILAIVFDECARAAAPGVTTRDLDALAERLIRHHGGIPAFKGKPHPNIKNAPFPGSICASVNDAVVHGIPDDRPLRPGDILGLDIGVQVNGYHADAAFTVGLFPVAPETGKLLRVAQEAMWLGIEQARPGNRVSDISRAVEEHARRHGFGVIQGLTGHGIGRDLWEGPEVPNYVDASKPANEDPILRAGMTICIEPMINQGNTDDCEQLPDNWTIVTKDRLPSAHFEHTVHITDAGPDILTLLPAGRQGHPFWMPRRSLVPA